MELKPIFKKVNFVSKYETICKNHNDFKNSLSGNNKDLIQKVLNEFNYETKYFSNGSFYQIKEKSKNILFQLHFVLKGGIVEILLFIYLNNKIIEPQGRIDFFPEDLDIPYDRLKYGLPKYCSEKELKNILSDFFTLYEDLKKEIIASYSN